MDDYKSMIIDYVRKVTGEQGKRRGKWINFHAPYRSDTSPSFGVNTETYRWRDLGLGQDARGDIDDLHKIMLNLGKVNFSLSPGMFKPFEEKTNCLAKEKRPLTTRPITHPILLAYAQSRGVSDLVLRKFCYEGWQGKFFYIAFPNLSGGFSLRNAIFKGNFGKADISIIHKNERKILVFEGFFDFMSFVSQYGEQSADYCVLNSTTNVSRLFPYLQRYDRVHCYLDNDAAGTMATEAIMNNHPNVVDHRPNYAQFNDVNEYILAMCR